MEVTRAPPELRLVFCDLFWKPLLARSLRREKGSVFRLELSIWFHPVVSSGLLVDSWHRRAANNRPPLSDRSKGAQLTCPLAQSALLPACLVRSLFKTSPDIFSTVFTTVFSTIFVTVFITTIFKHHLHHQFGFVVVLPRTSLLPAMINCSICHRPHNPKKLPFLCAVDARNCLYGGRIEIAQTLIEAEDAERRVEAVLPVVQDEVGGGGLGLGRKTQPSKSSAQIDLLRAEEAAASDRTSQIIAQADQLRWEMDAARKEIAAKKELMARKRSDLASVSAGTSNRRTRQLDEVERSAQRLRYKWNRSSDTMAATRAFLCEEAARLYGLRQVKKGSVKRYEIGGVEIFDLHAMNSKSSAWLSVVGLCVCFGLFRAVAALWGKRKRGWMDDLSGVSCCSVAICSTWY